MMYNVHYIPLDIYVCLINIVYIYFVNMSIVWYYTYVMYVIYIFIMVSINTKIN